MKWKNTTPPEAQRGYCHLDEQRVTAALTLRTEQFRVIQLKEVCCILECVPIDKENDTFNKWCFYLIKLLLWPVLTILKRLW